MRYPGKTYVIRDATEKDLRLLTVRYNSAGAEKVLDNGGWMVKDHQHTELVIPDYSTNADNNTYLMFVMDKGSEDIYDYKGIAYEGSDVELAIRDWVFKSKLSSNTLDTFSDIIDEL